MLSLLQLDLKQVEQAFRFLADPEAEHPPKELSHLSNAEWETLNRALVSLLEEREHHSLQ